MDFFGWDGSEAEFFSQVERYGVYYGGFSEVSQAALAREKEAKALFHNAKNEFEKSKVSDPKKKKHVLSDVVPPKLHLTSYTWKTFRNWVEDHHPGWKAKRRVLSKEELKLYLTENKLYKTPSKGKNYFISFVFQDPRSSKKEKKKTNETIEPEDANEEDQKPPAKKVKTTETAVSFGELPQVIQTKVLLFCDVPTLGAVVNVSKSLNLLAKQDCLWESHLKTLLRILFDGSLCIQVRGNNGVCHHVPDPATPLSEREDFRDSTALLRWYEEPRGDGAFKCPTKSFIQFLFPNKFVACKAHHKKEARTLARRVASKQNECPCEHARFLFQDVALRDYYHSVGNMVYKTCRGQFKCQDGNEGEYCSDCLHATYSPPKEFRGLPKIKWFL